MADAGGLQLLPETRKKIEIKMPGQNRLVVVAGVIAAIVIATYFFLVFRKNSLVQSISVIDQEILDVERSRDKEAEQRVLNLVAQLQVVNPILAAHVFWSDAFTKIQSITQGEFQFQSINADMGSSKIVIKASASSYTTVAKQVASFYSLDSIKDVIISKIQLQSTGRLEVTMEVKFDTNKFLMRK